MTTTARPIILKNQSSGGDGVIELKPIFLNQKSFYNKAQIEKTSTGKKLYSYTLFVAEINGKKATVYNLQSDSTLRHVKEFLKQEGLKADNKKQIVADYLKTV